MNHRSRISQPGTRHGPRQKGQSHPRSLHEGGFLKSSDPTAWGRAIRTLKCNTVYITRYRSMKIPVSFRTAYARADKNILVDSGATDNFIDPRLIQRLRLGTHPLERARKIWNIDGTNNKAGMITNYVDLSIQTGQKQAKMRFLITDLGNEDLILGYPWLANFEPKFSWKEGVIDTSYLPIIVRSLDWETRLNRDTISRITLEPLSEQERVQIIENLEEECSLKSTISTKLAQNARQYQDKVEIPKEYQKHWKVFSEEEAHRFPPSRPWDHAIELKEGAPKAIDCKVIPTTAEEDEALQKFLKEQLEKGYIRKSKSLYASAFFFIKKKDGKLRPIQDYRKLNEYTIKNKYPLPLIPELIAKVKMANIFSKFNIRWGYNNVRIKEGDEHKAAFKTKYGLYVTFSFCPTTRRYVGLPSFPSPPSSHRALVLLRSHLANAILSCYLLSCTITIWCCDTISHVRYTSTSHSYDY